MSTSPSPPPSPTGGEGVYKEARGFLRRTRSGVLSTHSARFAGYPFGSIAPFVLDQDGRPLILISTIAEHTRNIQKNPHVSLIAFDHAAPDMQAGGRLTLLGEASIADKQEGPLRARYLSYFPQAAQYFDMHDFLFHRIEIRQARYIGGFGNIHWIPGAELLPPANQLAKQEAGILAHMNADHVDSLRAYCRHAHEVEVESAEMVGIDTDGFDIRADGRLLRFGFETPVTDAATARTALVAMSKVAKG
jgi:heme iron utilization protein